MAALRLLFALAVAFGAAAGNTTGAPGAASAVSAKIRSVTMMGGAVGVPGNITWLERRLGGR